MKRTLLLSLLAVSAHAAVPSAAQIQAAVDKAVASWGAAPEVSAIRVESADCTPGTGHAAWTDLASRTIWINAACRWDARYLAVIITHELGHLLTGQGHSQSRHSVMFTSPVRTQRWQFLDAPHVTTADRQLLVAPQGEAR